MTTTLKLRDFLHRSLANATPGTTDATDYLSRDVAVGDLGPEGRALISETWTASTAYALGDFVDLSTGELLKAIVAGTSDVGEPTAPGYGNTVVDGGVTWEQVSG